MRSRYYIGLFSVLFATNAFSGVLFQDGFESGSKSFTQNGIRWTDSVETAVNSVRPLSGNYSLQFNYPAVPSGQDSFSEQRFTLGGNRPEVWIKYDIYVPTNYYHRSQSDSANNKGLVTLWSGSYGAAASDQFLGFEHWPSGDGSSKITYHPGPGRNDMGHISTNAYFVDRTTDLGKWIEWIVRIKVASSANNDGIVQVWKKIEGRDRQQVINVTKLNNYVSTGNYFQTGYLLGWSNSGFDQNTKLYIDNIVISDQPIEIGSNPPNPPTIIQIDSN